MWLHVRWFMTQSTCDHNSHDIRFQKWQTLRRRSDSIDFSRHVWPRPLLFGLLRHRMFQAFHARLHVPGPADRRDFDCDADCGTGRWLQVRHTILWPQAHNRTERQLHLPSAAVVRCVKPAVKFSKIKSHWVFLVGCKYFVLIIKIGNNWLTSTQKTLDFNLLPAKLEHSNLFPQHIFFNFEEANFVTFLLSIRELFIQWTWMLWLSNEGLRRHELAD